jgi:chemotaxis protein MotB
MPDKAPVIVKKIKKAGHAHHGGSWKVAFADFMTAMMAFFLVMWIIGLDQETRSAIAGYFQDPFNFMKKAEGKKLESILQAPESNDPTKTQGGGAASSGAESQQAERELLESVKEAVEETLQSEPELQAIRQNVDLRMSEEGLTIELSEGAGAVFFETGKATIREQALRLFARLGAILAKSNRRVVLDGHSDAQQYAPGAAYDNWNLSSDRAKATMNVLRTAGLQDRQVLAVRGFADRRLKVPADPKHFSNRRVTVMLPFTWKEQEVSGISGNLTNPIQAQIRDEFSIAPPPTGNP